MNVCFPGGPVLGGRSRRRPRDVDFDLSASREVEPVAVDEVDGDTDEAGDDDDGRDDDGGDLDDGVRVD